MIYNPNQGTYAPPMSQEPLQYIKGMMGAASKNMMAPMDTRQKKDVEKLGKQMLGEGVGNSMRKIYSKIFPQRAENLKKFVDTSGGETNIKMEYDIPQLGNMYDKKTSTIDIDGKKISTKTLGNLMVGYNAHKLKVPKRIVYPFAMDNEARTKGGNEDTELIKREYADRSIYELGNKIGQLESEGRLDDKTLKNYLMSAEDIRNNRIKELEKTIPTNAKAPPLWKDIAQQVLKF